MEHFLTQFRTWCKTGGDRGRSKRVSQGDTESEDPDVECLEREKRKRKANEKGEKRKVDLTGAERKGNRFTERPHPCSGLARTKMRYETSKEKKRKEERKEEGLFFIAISAERMGAWTFRGGETGTLCFEK